VDRAAAWRRPAWGLVDRVWCRSRRRAPAAEREALEEGVVARAWRQRGGGEEEEEEEEKEEEGGKEREAARGQRALAGMGEAAAWW